MSETKSIEERLKSLEEFVFMNGIFPKGYDPDSIRDRIKKLQENVQTLVDSQTNYREKLNIHLVEIDERLDTAENESGELMDGLEDLQSELVDSEKMSSDEITSQIKHYLKIFLRNSLGLNVSFDDKQQSCSH
jgi:vacuolar-type H+-ATPase subunit I/STV1